MPQNLREHHPSPDLQHQATLPLIKPEIGTDLFAYLGGIIHEMRGTALMINGTADHVHVLARIRPAHSPAEIARAIKPIYRDGCMNKAIRNSRGKQETAYSA